MRFKDNKQHHKPHVHAKCGNDEAVVGVDGELLAGGLPVREMKILVGSLACHEEEVYAAWNNAVQGMPFEKIKVGI